MMLPLLDDPAEVEYVWYIGDPLPTTGLYKRTGRYETPIYQNTRGNGVFVGADITDGNIDATRPTPAFWDALRQMASDDWPLDTDGCQWYEHEFIGALVNVAGESEDDELPTEIGQLLAHAEQERDTQSSLADHTDSDGGATDD